MAPYPSLIRLAELDGQNGFRIDGHHFDHLGRSVTGIGDVNNDGLSDFAVGSPAVSTGDTGKVFVVFGRAGGLEARPDIDDLDGSNGFRIDGLYLYDGLGHGIAGAGDVDGDGIDDFALGDFRADAAYVIYGRNTPFAPSVSLANPDGVAVSRFLGPSGSELGYSIDGCGDINADGLDDIIVSTTGRSSSTYDAYVVFGQIGGFGPSTDLQTLDGTNGFRINIQKGGVGLDSGPVRGAGDVNGDGIEDLIIANHHSATSYVVFGREGAFEPLLNPAQLDGTNGFRLQGGSNAVSAAGDINGDGYGDIVIGAPLENRNVTGNAYVVFGSASGFAADIDLGQLNGRNGFRIRGEEYGDRTGATVSRIGDFNADGIDDLLIGVAEAFRPGSAYIVFGKTGDWSPVTLLSQIPGRLGIRLAGHADMDRTAVVSDAGDVNGDGIADVIVGAPFADFEGRSSGAAYVVYGSLPSEAVRRVGTVLSQTIQGGAYADTLIGGAGDDSLIGHGGADALRGGIGDDVAFGGDREDFLAGGEGADSLDGGDAADLLRGGKGDDTLGGGAGADRMEGGAGSDLYRVDGGADIVIEQAGSGNDTVESTASFVLPQAVENLVLLGSAHIDGAGNDGRNAITGNQGNNVLSGRGGNDTLTGGRGADRLEGGAGADTLQGGQGDDIYVGVVQSGDGADTVSENAGGGIDTVKGDGPLSLAGLGEIERLILTGDADSAGTGNGLDNFLSGNTGFNALSGGAGNDTINGGTGADTLAGGDGADILNGGKGNDTMDGGAGADTFYFGGPNTHIDTILAFDVSEDRFDLGGGAFSSATDDAGNTVLTHAGGRILIAGVAGRSLADWNALIVPEGGATLAGEDAFAGLTARLAEADYFMA